MTIGEISGRTYAFVGLERAGGGVMIYDVSDPYNPEFIQYARSNADIAPEGLLFVTAEESPSGKPLMIVSNEVSATVTIYEIQERVPSSED